MGRSSKFMGRAPVPTLKLKLANGTVSAFGMEVLDPTFVHYSILGDIRLWVGPRLEPLLSS